MSVKVLVTGADGQLGKTIQDLYNDNDLGLEFNFVAKHNLDITNKNQIHFFFKEHRVDYCINCAAYTNVEQAEKTPEMAYKVNAEGVKNLAEACNKTNTVLIHISTDYVFDGEKGAPYLPNDLTNPINEYGKSKLLGEQYIQEIMSKFFIIRTSWLYSKNYGKNFYRTILDLAKTKEELTITTDQTGCPTNTESLSKFIIDLLVNKSTDYRLKHFSDNQVMTWYDFAKEILLENNLKRNTSLVKGNNCITFAKRPKYSVLQTG
jgi:dTDP-4-dehydrorhamnose reductase